MRKSLLIIIGCIISVILFQAFTTTHEPKFKNLRILPKDISEHDLDSVMHIFTASLGVKCNFCHVRNEEAKKMDFASDNKPEKEIARKMMLMAIDINKNYFRNLEKHDMDHDMDKDKDHDMNKNMDHDMDKNKDHDMDSGMVIESSKYMLRSVSCYTCHRGDPHPETKAPVPKEGPIPPEQPKPADKK